MRKTLVAIGSLVGLGVALLWLRVVGALMYGGRLSTFWYIVMFVSCPPIYLLNLHWILVPLLNAAIYCGLVSKITARAAGAKAHYST
jgi:hypothetical protein